MGDDAVVIAVVAGAVLLLVVLVLAPWRSPRRDALSDEDYYALMTGEEPPEPSPAPGRGDDEGPSAGDVRVP